MISLDVASVGLIEMLCWAWATLLLFGPMPAWAATTYGGKTSEAYHRRNTFYAGGQYTFSEPAKGTILTKQMYVEQLTPVDGVKHPHPLVFVHGGGVSGTQWLNKPDGNRGWASYFLEKGYEVFIVDIWGTGRSNPSSLPPLFSTASVELVELAFTAPEVYKKYYQAKFHTQWPGTGLRGDPSFDAFYSELLPLAFSPDDELIFRSSICAVLQRAGPSIFISHSFGTSIGLLGADGCPNLVKGHVVVEGDQTPFGNYDGGVNGSTTPIPSRAFGISDTPITYSPPVTDPDQLIKVEYGKLQFTDGLLSKYPCMLQADTAQSKPRQLINIAKSPILFLTGQASVHILYDQCLVQFLRQAGVRVTWTKLVDIGLFGNGHFSMLEKNSDDIAKYISHWLQKLDR